MKTFLSRATTMSAAVGIAALVASFIMGAYIRKNREARDAAYSSVVAAAVKKEKEEWIKEKAALEAETTKHPGTIGRMPLVGTGALAAGKAVNDEFDPAYFRLARWQTMADFGAIGFGMLALFGATARELIRRREAAA